MKAVKLFFYENISIQLKHILGFLKYRYVSKSISVFVSYLTFNIRFHQVPFFYYVFQSTTIFPVEFYCLPYFSVDLFCFISIFSLIYISPSVLSTEVLFSRNLMLLCDSQMSPNVLKAILNYKDFLSTFSTLVTYMQTLQPLLIYLAITMTLILPFLFPVKKTGCIVLILLVQNTDLLFKSSHSFPSLSYLSLLHGTLNRRNLLSVYY